MSGLRFLVVFTAVALMALPAQGQQAGPAPADSAPVRPAAAVPPLSRERDARLRERVTLWYEARRIRDQRALYNLLEPQYRTKVDFASYAKLTFARMRYDLKSSEIASIEATPEGATVRIRLVMDSGRFGETSVVDADEWVWSDGEWWAVFKPFKPPFRKPGQ